MAHHGNSLLHKCSEQFSALENILEIYRNIQESHECAHNVFLMFLLWAGPVPTQEQSDYFLSSILIILIVIAIN